MKKYRLYIDESGTHNYSLSDEWSKRYLSLTGIFLDQVSNEKVLQPAIFGLRKIFADDPDEMPVLHREEIISKTGKFSKLADKEMEAEFNWQFFSLLKNLEFNVCGVVIDKKKHFTNYGKAALHPYHYCLSVLLERYTYFLKNRQATGDVMAESRNKVEDELLKEAYKDFYVNGTAFRESSYIQSVLTSKEIKIKNKQSNIAGLELADLLSMPVKLDILFSFRKIDPLRENFSKKIIDAIQQKYCKGNFNKVLGYGKKII
jgi:hypothetical protein